MKNEKGITLVELLGVLVILSILLTLAGSILTSSLKTSNRATTDQRMQQEANYITEKVRNEYLEKVKDGVPETFTFEITIDNDNKKLLLNNVEVISEGYHYTFCVEEEEEEEKGACEKMKETIDRTKTQQQFQLKLTSKNDERSHIIDTQLSKLK